MAHETIRAALLCLLTGCAAQVADGPVCNPDGTYRLRGIPTSGDCPDIDTVARFRQNGQPTGDCTGNNEWTPDGCMVQLDVTCSKTYPDSEIWKNRLRGAVTFTENGGHGTVEMTIKAGGRVICSSVVDLRYTPL
ncbi:MAG: hypothetical protein MJD61_00710 [Proteobacteria bacterium]|nr:hypothetical protein [Pseudomonadota bacterium]